jgi:hypothetical protein
MCVRHVRSVRPDVRTSRERESAHDGAGVDRYRSILNIWIDASEPWAWTSPMSVAFLVSRVVGSG